MSLNDGKQTTEKIACFLCAACDSPLCTSSSIISGKMDCVQSAHTFAYELEDILDLPGSVWCYNCSETITTTVTVPSDLAPAPTEDTLQIGADPTTASSDTSNRCDLVAVSWGELDAVAVHTGPLLLRDVDLEEGHATVRQSRTSTSERWFHRFDHVAKLYCSVCESWVGWKFDPVSNEASTECFGGLMLRAMKQRSWTLADLLRQRRSVEDRWKRTAELGESRGSGEAQNEEVMLRLQSLRTQTNLYVDLLSKHREQSEVQKQLLISQRERIATHEEKISTMQQIIIAQRQQLEMQKRHMTYQDELLKNQREQLSTQQQQIEVEQMLLTEQNRTIQSQLGQLKILQAHVKARDEREYLESEIKRLRTEQATNEVTMLQGVADGAKNETSEHST